jgi:putative acyl-CoA dehydrogenase
VEACEAIGATAGVKTHPAARIAADLSALTQWDGTANEAALELAALVQRDGAVLREAIDELGADLGGQNEDIVDDVFRLGERAAQDAGLARTFAEQLAMLAAASAMRRNLPRAVADAYIATRLRDRFRAGFGALDGRFDADAILDFIVPED